jgi:hypothetical protein
VAIPKRIDKQRKRWRWLATAGIVEVIPRPGRAPFIQHPPETPLLEIWLRKVLRRIAEPETIKRCIEDLEFAIQDDLALRC